MVELSRLYLVRHGETVGNSRVRFHGRADVALSPEGAAQVRDAAAKLPIDRFDLVVSSPMQRAWGSAVILARGAPIRLEADFREIDFGRWEGLTAEEIEARDPVLYREWRGNPDFDFPGGERRQDFRDRVRAGLDRILGAGVPIALLVAHKGVIRTITERLCAAPLADGLPPLGGLVQLSRNAAGSWIHGRHASNPRAAYRMP